MAEQDNSPRQAVVNKLFGSVFGNVEQKIEVKNDNDGSTCSPTGVNDNGGDVTIASPLFLSKKKGTKIDLIRVMNAWYECGKVEDANGGKPTKKEFFTWVGKLFNINLSDYDKDLSNSMASSVAYDKQTRIFDELKEKQQEIYNSK